MVSYLQVLAIADGLHDVYTLGKEAAAVHSSLMTNLSKACHCFSLFITFPFNIITFFHVRGLLRFQLRTSLILAWF
jgi:hypothetical protein